MFSCVFLIRRGSYERKKKEVIEPVQEKKTYPKLLVGNPQTAILFLQRERKNSCGLYDPFGLCTIVDCLQSKIVYIG